MDDAQELDDQLGRVGIDKSDDIQLSDAIRAKHWTGAYAELFVVEAPETPDGLNAFLSSLDATIAKRLRQAREEGSQRDAHVCILVDNSVLTDPNLRSETEISRFVSRKYWINKDAPVEDILQRLTLAWVDVQESARSEQLTDVPLDLTELRVRIAQEKGAGAAAAFLARFQ